MTSSERVRIVLIARYPVVCAGLRRMLEGHDGLQVVGESASATDAVALLSREHADIVLIDTDDVSLRAVATVSEACDSRVLVFTAATDPGTCAQAIELGASGVVAKEQSSHLLVRAIEKVHAGEMWLDRDKTAMVLSRAVRRIRDPETMKIESLTNREHEIVALVGEGLSNARIAERLFISEATVRNHLTSILSKLNLTNRFELAVYTFRHHLVAHADGDGIGGPVSRHEDLPAPGARRAISAAVPAAPPVGRRPTAFGNGNGNGSSAVSAPARDKDECTNATSD